MYLYYVHIILTDLYDSGQRRNGTETQSLREQNNSVCANDTSSRMARGEVVDTEGGRHHWLL